MTGTNVNKDASETLKDFGADVNIGLHMSQIKIHIIKYPRLYQKYQKDYDIDIITGHSLGGRDAMILGMSNDIKHIVVYNPAPLAIKDVSGLYADEDELKN